MKKFLLSLALVGSVFSVGAVDRVFELVTDATSIAAGDQLIIAATSNDYAMSTTQNNNNRGKTEITVTNNQIVNPSDEVEVITVAETSVEGFPYALSVSTTSGIGYLYSSTSSSNYCKTTSTLATTGVAVKFTTGNNSETVITCNQTTKNLLRYNSTNGIFSYYGSGQNGIKVYRLVVNQKEVATPALKMIEGEWGMKVEMTCATEGATIYYTTDGTDPTTESDVYTEPVEIWAETTINAIAYVGEKDSNIATVTFNPPYILDGFNELASFELEATQTVPVIVNANMTVAYQNGQSLYVTAGNNGAMLLYGVAGTYEPGDTFTKVTGDFVLYNGLPEIKNVTVVEGEKGEAPEPKEIESVALVGTLLNHYLAFSNIMIDDIETVGNKTQATMMDADAEICTLRDNFNIGGIVAGENFKVIGFAAIYNGTAQFYPVEILPNNGKQTVAVPTFSLPTGTYVEGTPITIECATEGATIYYTTDEAEDAEYVEYTETLTLTESMTVKAYAVMEGEEAEEWLASAVTEATYTVKEPVVISGNNAVFTFNVTDWSDMEWDTEVTRPETISTGASVDGRTISNNGIEIKFAKGTSQNNPVQFRGTETAGDNLRLYNGNSLTITSPEKIYITSITLEYANSKWGMNVDASSVGTLTKGDGTYYIWAPETTETRAAVEKVRSVTFNATATTQINTITVAFDNQTGVEEIAEENVAPVYYNLQGVRVANPTSGLYIRVNGNKATKVLVK